MGEDEQRGRERNGSSRSLNVKQTNFNPTRGPHSSKDETEVRKRGGETPHLGVRGAVNTQTERLPGSMLFALMSDTRRSEVTGAHATGDRTALEPAENLTDVFLSLQMKNHLPSNPPPLPSPPSPRIAPPPDSKGPASCLPFPPSLVSGRGGKAEEEVRGADPFLAGASQGSRARLIIIKTRPT